MALSVCSKASPSRWTRERPSFAGTTTGNKLRSLTASTSWTLPTRTRWAYQSPRTVSDCAGSGSNLALSLSSSFWVHRRTNKAAGRDEVDAEYRGWPTLAPGGEAVVQVPKHRMAADAWCCRSGHRRRVTQFSLLRTVAHASPITPASRSPPPPESPPRNPPPSAPPNTHHSQRADPPQLPHAPCRRSACRPRSRAPRRGRGGGGGDVSFRVGQGMVHCDSPPAAGSMPAGAHPV